MKDNILNIACMDLIQRIHGRSLAGLMVGIDNHVAILSNRLIDLITCRVPKIKDELVLWGIQGLKWQLFCQEVRHKDEKVYNVRNVIVLIVVAFYFLVY